MTRSSTLLDTEFYSDTPRAVISSKRRVSRVLWVNDRASEQGGCERYTRLTADTLAGMGVTSSLLYDPNRESDPDFLRSFERAYPAVDIGMQVEALDPDVIYVQQITRPDILDQLLATGHPVVRFLHDHQLFCLREHKYDPVRQQTCTRTTGLGCYACPGFVARGPEGSLRFRSLRSLHGQQTLHRRLAGCVVGSRYMRDHLIAHRFDPDRVHTIPLFAPTTESTRKKTDKPVGSQAHLLFVGQLTRGKGLDLLLRSLEHLPVPIPLTVVGDGPQASEYRELTKRLGLEGSVVFLGRGSPDLVADLYKSSTALVLPSRTPETFGLVGVEAMSHGLPTIAARVGGISEWLEDGVTGLFFESGNTAELADCIDRLRRDPMEARRLGRAGRQAYERRFRTDHHARALLDVLSTIVERENTPFKSHP